LSKAWAVVKREFGETTRTKMFILGTLFGPILILLLMFAPLLFMGSSFGERDVVVLDATGEGLGNDVATGLAVPLLAGDTEGRGNTYNTTVQTVEPAEADAAIDALRDRVRAEELSGFVYLPHGLRESANAQAAWEGRSAGQIVSSEIRRAVQQAVQQRRLQTAGIDPSTVGEAMRPVRFESRKVGEEAAAGTTESLMLLSMVLGYSIFLVVMLYGQQVMRGVLEEKRDKIAEMIFSSMRARDLMYGKIAGIGGAGLLQMAVWTIFAGLAMTYGAQFFQERGQNVVSLIPDVPWEVGAAFLVFFFGGFLLYSALYAVIGAIATTDQEANQLVFPVMLPLFIGFFMLFAGLENPDAPVFVAGSLIPFTSPVTMPVRMILTPPPAWEVALSIGLLALTIFGVAWGAAKVYRIGMLSTGKRPSMREVMRWLRTA